MGKDGVVGRWHRKNHVLTAKKAIIINPIFFSMLDKLENKNQFT